MKLTIGQKAARVLTFLLGLRHPQIAAALVRYGFSEAELQRGWQLLGGLSKIRLNEFEALQDSSAIAALDRFENTWFPIARASLGHRYPNVAAALFRGLGQTGGVGVAVTVTTFVERLRWMDRGEGEFAGEGAAARQLLALRGLDDATVREAEALIERIQSVRDAVAPRSSAQEQQEAQTALWTWYLEWSAISRVAIRDRRMLRALGFLGNKRRVAEDDVMDDVETTEAASQDPAVTSAPADARSARSGSPGNRAGRAAHVAVGD